MEVRHTHRAEEVGGFVGPAVSVVLSVMTSQLENDQACWLSLSFLSLFGLVGDVWICFWAKIPAGKGGQSGHGIAQDLVETLCSHDLRT